MIKIHSIILMACSTFGFVGHYIQFGIFRVTPWIPAIVGVVILILATKKKPFYYKFLPLILIVLFGLLTTFMCIEFLLQAHQPIRKKVIFSLMSISAWPTIFYEIRGPKKYVQERLSLLYFTKKMYNAGLRLFSRVYIFFKRLKILFGF